MTSEQLVAQHMPLARRQALKFCKDGKLDHLQDEMESAAMLGLVKASRVLIHTASFESVAYACIRNEMLMVLRRIKQRKDGERHSDEIARRLNVRGFQFTDSETGQQVADMTSIDPLDLDTRVLVRQIARRMMDLPEQERELIRLRCTENCAVLEAHRRCGFSNKASGWRAERRALASLRKKLRVPQPSIQKAA